MRLYDESNQRLYINQAERDRFMRAAEVAELPKQALCLTLLYTGCRLSEALALTSDSVDPIDRLISFRTLKQRRHQVREVPIPPILVEVLLALAKEQAAASSVPAPTARPLFTHNGKPLNRITGYRWVKSVMQDARVSGPQASPKGLRHGYGVHAVRRGVQLNMLSKWMGHSSIAITAIYANAMGLEEMEIAERMWG